MFRYFRLFRILTCLAGYTSLYSCPLLLILLRAKICTLILQV